MSTAVAASTPLTLANTDAVPSLAHGTDLVSALPGRAVRIVAITQDEENASWLRAVGMHEDAEVTVLRRAPFGGPIHLRSSDGGEFAIHRDLARCIRVAAIA